MRLIPRSSKETGPSLLLVSKCASYYFRSFGAFTTALFYGLDERGFESRQGLGIFLFTTVSRTTLKPNQPPIQWAIVALYLGVKRTGREADHSFPSSAEVKNVWSYTSTPQYVFKVWCLAKHRNSFKIFEIFIQM